MREPGEEVVGAGVGVVVVVVVVDCRRVSWRLLMRRGEEYVVVIRVWWGKLVRLEWGSREGCEEGKRRYVLYPAGLE